MDTNIGRVRFIHPKSLEAHYIAKDGANHSRYVVSGNDHTIDGILTLALDTEDPLMIEPAEEPSAKTRKALDKKGWPHDIDPDYQPPQRADA